MILKKLLQILFFSLLCFACSSEKQQQSKDFIEIDMIPLIEGKAKEMPLQEWAKSVRFIPLEINEGALTTPINNVFQHGDTILVYQWQRLSVFDKNGKINEELSDPMIVKYFELNNKYHFKVNMECADMIRGELLNNTQLKQDLFFKKIATEIRTELSKFGYTDSEISDILVKLLYHIKPSSHKSVLWFCYGNYIVENINKHIKSNTKAIQCVDCGEWFEVNIKDTKTCRCEECSNEHKRELTRLRVQKYRMKSM